MKLKLAILTSILIISFVSADNLTIDGNITNTGKLGIGTNDPQTSLSIRGYSPPVGSIWGSDHTIQFHNGSLGNNGWNGLWLKWNVYREAGTPNMRYIDYQNRPNAAEMFMWEGGFTFRTATHSGNPGDIISMNNVLQIQNNGYIGIGIATPESRLDVNGNTRIRNDLAVNGISRLEKHVEFNKSDTTMDMDFYSSYNGIDDINNGAFAYGVRPIDDGWHIWERGYHPGWTNLFSVKHNGNIGIGTRTPEKKLHVAGDVKIDGSIELTPQGDIPMFGQ